MNNDEEYDIFIRIISYNKRKNMIQSVLEAEQLPANVVRSFVTPYIILHNVFNTFNGLSHSCLSGSFEIAKVKIEGQMQKALIWVLVDDLLVGGPQATSGDRLEDHAMTMP